MAGLLISFLNVLVVISAIGLALYVGSRGRATIYASSMVALGTAAYAFEIYRVVSSGECSDFGSALIDFLIGVSQCIGLGDRGLAYAQILILSGVLVLVFRPLARRIREEVNKNHESQHIP